MTNSIVYVIIIIRSEEEEEEEEEEDDNLVDIEVINFKRVGKLRGFIWPETGNKTKLMTITGTTLWPFQFFPYESFS